MAAMFKSYSPDSPEVIIHWESPRAPASVPAGLPLGRGSLLLTAMASDDDLRKKYNITQEDIDQHQDQFTQHAFYQAFGRIVTGEAATGREQRTREYLKEKAEIEAQKKKSSTMWMMVFSPNDGYYHAVEVKLDTGAEQNFINEALVARLRLPREALAQSQDFDGANGPFTCKSKVELYWEGQDKEVTRTEFFVLPAASNVERPLVREDLIEEFREKLFLENPRNSVAYVAAKKMKDEEKAQVQPLREQLAADQAESSRRREAEQKKRKEGVAARESRHSGGSSARSSKRVKK